MKHRNMIRILSLLIAVTMLCGLLPLQVFAADGATSPVRVEQVENDAVSAALPLDAAEEADSGPHYRADETVRVSILLEDAATIERYSTDGIAENSAAMGYRGRLERKQIDLSKKIASEALNGSELDVVWNLTLAANMISANVKYGQIEDIKQVDGVADVILETRYEPMVLDRNEGADPNTATSPVMIGTSTAYDAGYTGAGTRIAVIDTGIDPDHQSFDAGAFQYALQGANVTLMDEEEISEKINSLNVYKNDSSVTAGKLSISAKIPFAYNYVDGNYTVDHDHDSQGSHGSHVAGIAAANRYVPDGEGYTSALDAVHVQGVAPDAQILVMKVFGQNGGAYDSDYVAAIEDAIILGADAINLSLGSGYPGNGASSNETYRTVFENLSSCGAVVTISAGNSGTWAENSYNPTGYLYAEDVSMQTGGSPGSYTNSLSVASVDNDGATGTYFTVGEDTVIYRDGEGENNLPLSSLIKEYDSTEIDYLMIDGVGDLDDMDDLYYAGYDLTDMLLICARGEITFAEKARNATDYGAIGTIVYNNTDGVFGMDLTGYIGTEPAASITRASAELLRENAEPVYDDWTDELVCYVGTLTLAEGITSGVFGSDYYTMSSFSSWGVPGSLELKPEITAPGGSIYSIDGVTPGGKAYVTESGTSMAAPQVAGMAALLSQHLAKNSVTGISVRGLSQSLLMSTAKALKDKNGNYYSVLQQGAGLANIGDAVSAGSYVVMGSDATKSYADGKVKAELGDDPDRSGTYSFSFTLNNLTGEKKFYTLSADLFTQDLFTYGGTSYLDTATTPLDFNVSWTVDDQPLSTNVPTVTCQQILDYVAGDSETINMTAADYDGDGRITSYDAYLCLLDTAQTVTLPENGSVTVGVTLTLTAAQKAALTWNYPNGAYIEGYVFATEAPTAEGVTGTTHSIPVLGFYGDWSEPSMYDVGTEVAYSTGAETRDPYVGSETANYVTVKYADKSGRSYYFGGNPVFDNETYASARNAINPENGDRFGKIGYTLIRNAIAGRIAVLDADGKVVWKQDLGETGTAFYYENAGDWYNTSNAQSIGWSMAGVKDGETYTLQLTMATEYDVAKYDTEVWDKLGNGASLSMPFTIDTTAPKAEVTINEGGSLTVKAQDNQYLAAVMLATADGSKYVRQIDPKQTSKNQEVTLTIDGSGLSDAVYLLQVYDYAMNCTTYRVFLNEDAMTNAVDSVTVAPETLRLVPGGKAKLTATVLPITVANASVTWSSSNNTVATVDQNGNVTANAVGTCEIKAVSTLDGTVGVCQVKVFTIGKTLNAAVWDVSTDESSNNIYWGSFQTDGLPNYTPLSGQLTDIQPTAAAYDSDGTLYAASVDNSGNGSLYKIDANNSFAAKKVGGISDIFYSDMAQAPHLNAMLAIYGPYILVVDKETGDYTGYFELYSNDLAGLAYCGSFYNYTYHSYVDSYLLVDTAGNVYRQSFLYKDGSYSYFNSEEDGFLFQADALVNTNCLYCSAYYDGEYLYWSVYDQDAGYSRLFAMDVIEAATYDLGAFGEDVWPVAGLFELGRTDPSALAEDAVEELIAPEGEVLADMTEGQLPESSVASGSLHSVVQPRRTAQTYSKADPAEDSLTVKITAQNQAGVDIATHNGLITVSYDSDTLELKDVSVHAAYSAVRQSEGAVVIAYAGRNVIPAGNTVATLTFSGEGESMTILHQEANDAVGGEYEEVLGLILEACEHENDPEYFDYYKAVEATCTEDGNLEYWQCSECGVCYLDAEGTEEIDEADTILPALGHDPEYRDGWPATEDEEGYTGDLYCSRCELYLGDGRVIPMLTDATLDEALNVEDGELHFKSTGVYPWTAEADWYNEFAASGNAYAENTVSTITTTVTLQKGEGLHFYWKLSGVPYTANLQFRVNGALEKVWYADGNSADAMYSDELDWNEYTYAAVTAGTYQFSWVYSNVSEEDEGCAGLDKAYLDEVAVVSVEPVTVQYRTDGNGTFAGGSGYAEFSMPEGYRLTSSDVPTPVAQDGYTFLGWFRSGSKEAVEPVGQNISETCYVARFGKAKSGYATIILESHSVFPDGVGYWMLLDNNDNAAQWFSSMNLVTNIDYKSWADYTIPCLEDSNISKAQVFEGEVAIQVPAGQYDWVICYPYVEGDRYLLTAMDLDYPSYRDDFNFVAGYTYRFETYANADGRHDSVRLTITEGLTDADEVKDVTIRFEAGEHGTLTGQTEFTAKSTTALVSGKTPKPVADEGYYFAGWEPEFKAGTTIKGNQTYTARFEEMSDEPATIILEVHDVQRQAIECYVAYYMANDFDEETARSIVEGSIQPYDYAMLFDIDASVLDPASGLLTVYDDAYYVSLSGDEEDMDEAVMDAFEYVTPEGFDGTLDCEAMLRDGRVEIEIPAGTYDYVIASRSYNLGQTSFATVTNLGDASGFAESFEFQPGMTYHFTVTMEMKEVDFGGGFKMDAPAEVVTLEVYKTPAKACTHPNLQHVPAKQATATKSGNREYWYCPDCEKFFADSACTQEVEWADLVIPSYGATITPVKPVTGKTFPFTDVQKTDPYYEAVRYVYEHGIMEGTGKQKFSPGSTLTRAMVVTVLYRMEGEPDVTFAGTFGDVTGGLWYSNSVEWAAKCGVVNGYTTGDFGPNDPVTREQLAAILYRYAVSKGYPLTSGSGLDAYTDSGKISPYAVDAVRWAVSCGILEGSEKTLQPRDAATRAQVAIALYAFMTKVAK